jgi:hypothetical protein
VFRWKRTHQSAGCAVFVCFLFLCGQGVGDFRRLREGYYGGVVGGGGGHCWVVGELWLWWLGWVGLAVLVRCFWLGLVVVDV